MPLLPSKPQILTPKTKKIQEPPETQCQHLVEAEDSLAKVAVGEAAEEVAMVEEEADPILEQRDEIFWVRSQIHPGEIGPRDRALSRVILMVRISPRMLFKRSSRCMLPKERMERDRQKQIKRICAFYDLMRKMGSQNPCSIGHPPAPFSGKVSPT